MRNFTSIPSTTHPAPRESDPRASSSPGRRLARRRAAVAVGVAAALGAGGIGLVSAASTAVHTAFVPITPCRLIDTRPSPDLNTGPRSTPIGQDQTVLFNAHEAKDGDSPCAIPASATAVAANAVAIAPTARTYLTLYPGDVANPGTANLNVDAGQAPTPNAANIPLAADGSFNVYNESGTVDLVIDINGYYLPITGENGGGVPGPAGPAGPAGPSGVDQAVLDRLAAVEEATAELAVDVEANAGDIAEADANQPFVLTARSALGQLSGVDVDYKVVSLFLKAPADGYVTVNSTTNAADTHAGGFVNCSITTGASHDTDFEQRWESAGVDGSTSQLAGTRRFEIAAGSTVEYKLICRHSGASLSSQVYDSVLTATYLPAP